MDKFGVGDRVVMSPMWKYSHARGSIIKITKDGYVVVSWDGINGDWYFTEEQIKSLHHEDISKDVSVMMKTWGDI